MAIINGNSRVLVIGIAVGAVAATMGREFFTPFRQLGRPLAKAAIKSGMTILERGQESVALMGEHLTDLMAEAEAERQQALARQ